MYRVPVPRVASHFRRSLPSCDEIIVVSPPPVYHLFVRRRKGKFGSHFLMIMKYYGMRYLCELAKMLGLSTPAAKNVDNWSASGLLFARPPKEAAAPRFSLSLLRSDGTKGGFSLPCNAYIASACLVSHVHGGWPYTNVPEARMSMS
jgi:hypothetical protein